MKPQREKMSKLQRLIMITSKQVTPHPLNKDRDKSL
jgi:hypothetical protein